MANEEVPVLDTTTGDGVADVLPRFGGIDDLCGIHVYLWTATNPTDEHLFDWFRTAVNPAAENLNMYFDFCIDNELRCGHHGMFRKRVARGMRICERVPPDPTVALALVATRMRVPVDVPAMV